MTMRLGGAGVAAALVALPAVAQVGNGAAPVPAATPTAAATSVPIPPPPVIVLPIATPTPRATAAPAAARTPEPRRTAATARPTPAPTASPRPVASPTVAATPATTPSATPTPTPIASPTPIITLSRPLPPADVDDGTGRYWLVGLAAGLIALGLLGWVLLRRRRADAIEPVEDAAWVEEAPPVEAVATPRARLAIAFRPRRAGLNMLSATSENEITVTNIGDAPAVDIRLQQRLISAHAGQDTELAAFYAEPIGRAAVPPFALAPGETRAVNAVAALPREAIRTLTAAGRPMFVPIVAVNLLYDSGAGEGQLAQAFAVGVERVDSPKLAPFWLDTPPKSHDQVAARPHAAALER